MPLILARMAMTTDNTHTIHVAAFIINQDGIMGEEGVHGEYP